MTGSMIYYAFEHPETRPAKANWHARPRPAYPFRHPQCDVRLHRTGVEGAQVPPDHLDSAANGSTAGSTCGWPASSRIWAMRSKPSTRQSRQRRQAVFLLGRETESLQSVVTKFSRRNGRGGEAGREARYREPYEQGQARHATSRQHKRADMTLADYREYVERPPDGRGRGGHRESDPHGARWNESQPPRILRI